MTDKPTVAILGASPNPDRYSWKAQQLLTEKHYPVVPVSSRYDRVGDLPAVPSLAEAPRQVDTVTVYLNPTHLAPFLEQMLDTLPRRVIFNPGSESAEAGKALREAGVEVVEACTLVMLRTGQF